jgi:hypothetical protein
MLVASLFDLALAGASFLAGDRLRCRTCLWCWEMREVWLVGCWPRAWADCKRLRARWDRGDGGASRGGVDFGGAMDGMDSLVGEEDILRVRECRWCPALA